MKRKKGDVIMATQFDPIGPLEIPVDNKAKVKRIEKQQIQDFLGDENILKKIDLSKTRGCYIFALRAGKGFTPWYVGQAKKNFKQEILAVHKKDIYNSVLANKNGTPVMFLVSTEKKNKSVESEICELESFLIFWARKANKNLKNVKKNKTTWGISGVYNSDTGKPSNASKNLKGLLNLEGKIK